MPAMDRIPQALFNKDLSGYRFVELYEASLSIDDRASRHLGYYMNPQLVTLQYKGKGWFGTDPYLVSTLALMKEGDDTSAYILTGGTFRQVDVVPNQAYEAYQRAISKLTPEELAAVKGKVY